MNLQEAIKRFVDDREYFETKAKNAAIILRNGNQELITIPMRLIFSDDWMIQREITAESNPELYKALRATCDAFGLKESKEETKQ